jgi:hypothetical protein
MKKNKTGHLKFVASSFLVGAEIDVSVSGLLLFPKNGQTSDGVHRRFLFHRNACKECSD